MKPPPKAGVFSQMRKKHKNELFQFLVNSKIGIDKFDFEKGIEDGSGFSMIQISLKDTPFYFKVRVSEEDFNVFDYQFIMYNPTFSPTEFSEWLSFSQIMDTLDYWMKNHVSEYLLDEHEPDLWEEFKKGNKTFSSNSIDFDDQGSFSNDEKIQIKLSLNELKLLINKNIATSSEEQQIVNARLDYLIDAVDRLNKYDWQSLVISTLISISISLSLDTEKGHLLFELFKKVFSMVSRIAAEV
ncbi:MAG: hypothetical protein ACT4ON_01205 [Bacteroidota bacterium]